MARSEAPARPELTITEAADAAGVNPKTIRRAIAAGRLDGAHQDQTGRWLVPVEALIGAGYPLHTPAPPDELAAVRRRADAAERRAELAERHAEVAEAIAGERERSLDDLRMALRKLTAGSPTGTA